MMQLFVEGLMSNIIFRSNVSMFSVRVVMSATISHKNYVRFVFTLFVFVCVQWFQTHNVLYFLFCLSLSCAPNVVSFSGLFILDSPFRFSRLSPRAISLKHLTSLLSTQLVSHDDIRPWSYLSLLSRITNIFV